MMMFKLSWLTIDPDSVSPDEGAEYVQQIAPSCVWYQDRVFQIWGLMNGMACTVANLTGNHAAAIRHVHMLLDPNMNPVRVAHAHLAIAHFTS
jgi:hypothetical protein